MGCQIVEDDHIALLQNGGKLGFNIGVEDDAVHWCVDHPRCNKTSAFEASDQGLGAPVAKGCLGVCQESCVWCHNVEGERSLLWQ